MFLRLLRGTIIQTFIRPASVSGFIFANMPLLLFAFLTTSEMITRTWVPLYWGMTMIYQVWLLAIMLCGNYHGDCEHLPRPYFYYINLVAGMMAFFVMVSMTSFVPAGVYDASPAVSLQQHVHTIYSVMAQCYQIIIAMLVLTGAWFGMPEILHRNASFGDSIKANSVLLTLSGWSGIAFLALIMATPSLVIHFAPMMAGVFALLIPAAMTSMHREVAGIPLPIAATPQTEMEAVKDSNA